MIILGALGQQHSVHHSSWGWRLSLQLTGFRLKKTYVLVLFRVSHTGSPLVLYSFISYLVRGIDRCKDTCAAVRGGFQLESPNQLLGLEISVSFRNSGTILIIGFILWYPVIIRSIRAHPKQLLVVSGFQGVSSCLSEAIQYPAQRSQNLCMHQEFSPALKTYRPGKFAVPSDTSFLEGVTLF